MIHPTSHKPSLSGAGNASLFTAIARVTLLGTMVLASACQPKPVAETQAAQPATQSVQTEASPAPEIASKNVAASEAPTPPSKASKAIGPAKTDVSAAAGKVLSIAGGWVNAGGACDSGASVQFNPDGTYMSEGENGTWALNGKKLTVTTTAIPDAEASATQGPEQSTGDVGEKAILTVLSVTDSSASVILSNGSTANWTRCSS